MAYDLVCIVCPNGCHLHVDDNFNVTGNRCPRGPVYAKQEVTNPTRVVTSTVRINSKVLRVLPVKTKVAVSKKKIFDVMNVIEKTEAKVPVHIGDVIVSNVADTGVDLVATRDILE
jgi:CxxC motif-containing protein